MSSKLELTNQSLEIQPLSEKKDENKKTHDPSSSITSRYKSSGGGTFSNIVKSSNEFGFSFNNNNCINIIVTVDGNKYILTNSNRDNVNKLSSFYHIRRRRKHINNKPNNCSIVIN